MQNHTLRVYEAYYVKNAHIHTVTVVITEGPYTPGQTALYYHMTLIRMALLGPACRCYSWSMLE